MEKDSFYDIKNVPFTDRESFNNTILLLTLVKSDYYYILGFDRLMNVIEIAFDFESEQHSKITETVTVNFNSSESEVVFQCIIKNAYADDTSKEIVRKRKDDCLSIKNGELVFEWRKDKNSISPISVATMNKSILRIKADVFAFLEEYYKLTVNK